MFRWFTRMPLSILLAIALHLLIILSVLIAWKFNAFSAASQSSSTSNEPVIQAQSVSQAAIDQQVNRLKHADEQREKSLKQQQAEAQQAAAARRAEQARLQQLEAMREAKQKAAAAQEQQLKALQDEQKKAQESVQAQKQALAKMQEEAAKAAAEKQAAQAAAAKERATAAAAKQAAAEAAAQAEQAKKQAAAEKAAAEKAAKEQAAKEKAAKAAADKAAKEKAANLAAQKAAQARKAALQQQLQDELSASQAQGILAAYAAAIQQKVTAQWFKPPGWQPDWTCDVRISQAKDGTVLNVKILQCDGDQLFQRSVQQAVERASPLPLPSDMSLFQSTINFKFRANTQ